MNSIHFIAALTMTLTGVASMAADQNAGQGNGQALTRASVLQDLGRARQEGAIGTYGDSDRSFNASYTTDQQVEPSRTRVLAELQRARDNGELSINSDLYGANLMIGRPIQSGAGNGKLARSALTQ